jgi:hypothetical protein
MTVSPSPRAAARALWLLGAGLALGAASIACAADGAASAPRKGGVASLGKGPANQLPVLTRNELRECLKQQDKLKADEDAIVAEQRDLDAEKASVAQEGEALKGELAALDRTAASAVEAYNAKAVAHDKRVDAYNTHSKPFNAKVADWQGARASWSRDCGNRRYKEDDLIIIQAGR